MSPSNLDRNNERENGLAVWAQAQSSAAHSAAETSRLSCGVSGIATHTAKKHGAAFVKGAHRLVRGSIEVDEIWSLLFEVTHAIEDLESPPVFRSERDEASYVWVSLKNRVRATLRQLRELDSRHVSFDAIGDSSADMPDTKTMMATTFGALPGDELLDLQIALARGKITSSLSRYCTLIRCLIAVLGYKVTEVQDPLFILREVTDHDVRLEIERYLGSEFIRWIDANLALLAVRRSSGSIGTASRRGQEELARVYGGVASPAVKRPRRRPVS